MSLPGSSESLPIEPVWRVACPGCGKENASKGIPPNWDPCARCGCELTTLGRLAFRAEADYLLAVAALREGDHASAAELAFKSWELMHSRRAASVGLLANAALGNLSAAADWAASRGLIPR